MALRSPPPAGCGIGCGAGWANGCDTSHPTIDEVMAACPPLPQGQGLVVCAGADKQATMQDKLTADALARNKASEPDAGIGDDLKSVLEGEGGFDKAAKILHARNRNRTNAAAA